MMRPSFYPKMVNGPFDDPGVFVPFLFQHRAILFDLGEIYTLSARDILKISHIFVSHDGDNLRVRDRFVQPHTLFYEKQYQSKAPAECQETQWQKHARLQYCEVDAKAPMH